MSEVRWKSVIEHINAAVLVEDEQGRIALANRQAYQLLFPIGQPESLIGRSLVECRELCRLDSADANVLFSYGVGEFQDHEISLTDGTILVRSRVPLLEDDHVLGVLWQFRNVTVTRKALRALRESEERYRKLIEVSPDPVFVHCEGLVVFANEKAKQYFGVEHVDELLGRSIMEFIHPDDHELSRMRLEKAKHSNAALDLTELKLVSSKGEIMDVEVSVSPITYEGKQAFIGIARNITERKLQEQRLQEANEMLRRLSHMDGLTGIPNRRYFDETMNREWKRGARNSTPLSVIMIDIDCFKDYNDYYGHQGGDECLKLVADTLSKHLDRTTDFISRFGGEEFAVILPETTRSGAAHVAEKLRKAVEALAIPHKQSKVGATVTISVGAAGIVPNAFTRMEELIAQADKALYQAKQNGRNRVQLF